MKRLHIHETVKDLETSIKFYQILFSEAPTVIKDDYAKWMLDDPRVNFAISTSDSRLAGIDHLGIQVDSESELTEIAERLKAADENIVAQEDAQCCYAVSDKAWTADPEGVAWETFHTTGDIARYGEDDLNALDLPPRVSI
jgi:hypothetical protein